MTELGPRSSRSARRTRSTQRNWFNLCGIEAAVVHEKTYPSRKDEYGPALANLIETGRGCAAPTIRRSCCSGPRTRAGCAR